MNKTFAQENFDNLMNLVTTNDSFLFKDFAFDEKTYRIFNYQLASWGSFKEPSAKNCRGIMFDVTDLENISLVSLPPEKFFNYEEGSVNHELGRVGDKMVKMDGSLISTYKHEGQLYLKSKAALFSSHANDAMRLLDTNLAFKDELEKLVDMGFTVNLEHTSPESRIVIPYQTEELTVLSARSHETGENFFATKLKAYLEQQGGFDTVLSKMVQFENLSEKSVAQKDFVETIRQEPEGEGYVVEIILNDKESYLTKIKTLKYSALHHTKDNVESDRYLFEAIIMEASDDLRSMFATDPYVLNKIERMENHIHPIFNSMVRESEDFYEKYKGLERKDYAILAKKEYPNLMPLMMKLYLGMDNDYKEYAIKNKKDLFGIKEEKVEEKKPTMKI